MGGLKKSKGGGKGRGKGPKGEGRRETKKPSQDDTQRGDLLLPLQERVAAVKPFWETISQEERVKLLTVTIDELKQRAADLAERQRKQAAAEDQMYPGETLTFDLEPSIEELLQLGIGRLHEKPTWKLWQWLPEQKEFLDADSFRNYMETEHIEENFRALLPKEEGKPVEKPPEAALRLRMAELLQRVHQHNRQLQEEPVNGNRRARTARATPDQIGAAMRDSNIELINIMMEALEQEHEFLYHAVLFPITGCICELLEEGQRESTCMDLCYEDLEKLHPDEVARICEWLTEKVDGFSSKIKPEAKDVEEEDEEEEGIGDVDLFSLSGEREHLLVNAKWLQHLQERVLGDDGQPRKMKEGEDPYHMGLVLEWVYGTIVSTAEKARDGAKRALGTRPPTATQAHDQLVHALREQQTWEKRYKDAKELLKRMLKSRKDIFELAQDYDVRPTPPRPNTTGEGYAEPGELPEHVIVAMLHREVLLTEAKLHALDFELVTAERKLRQLRSQLRQGEPEFERLKRELEEVKNQPRGLEGTFRSAAEMERHRAQMADAAIEEQLEVQTAFREHGARLQGIYDKRQRTEMEVARKEQEIKQLKGWRSTVQSLIDRFEEQIANGTLANDSADTVKEENEVDEAAASHHQALEAATRSLTGQDVQLSKLRSHFQKDVRRQLYGDEDDRTFFDWIRTELRAVEKKLEDGRAVLHHLEMFLVNVACNDPGAAIGANLVLPLLQDRLDAKALDFAAQRAAAAEEAIIKMEEEKAERVKQERERRQKMKQKAKDKVRTEKERLLAERDAKLEAERAVREESKRALVEKEELLRKQKQEEMEQRRKAEEEEMEARRKELLSEEDGYWRRRMAQDAQQQALQEAIVKPAQDEDEPSASSASDQTNWKDDNDGFQDTARGPRRSRSLKGVPVRVNDPETTAERPANGYARANGRVDESRFHHRPMREHDGGYRENGVIHRDRRPTVYEGRTLPIREVRPIRNLSGTGLEKPRSGRLSPQQGNEVGNKQQGPTTLPFRPRAYTATERPKPSIPQHDEKPATPRSETVERETTPAAKEGDAETDSSGSATNVPQSYERSEEASKSPAQAEEATQPSEKLADELKETSATQPPPVSGVPETDPARQEEVPDSKTAPIAQQADQEQGQSSGPGPTEEPREQHSAALPEHRTASEEHVGRSEPSSTAPKVAGPELAPGTPAQQAPPLPMLAPTPNMPDNVPHQSGGGVIFMQNRHMQPQRNPVPRMVPSQGQLGPHPAIEMDFSRPLGYRREGGPLPPYAVPHAGQGMMNGPVPVQTRRPQIASMRPQQEGGMHPPAFQRSYPRGQPPPPGAPSTASFSGASHAESAEPGVPPATVVPPPFAASNGSQPGGPHLAYPPPQMSHPKLMGTQPMPQHVFVGNMVNPPFSMLPGSQMMNGMPGPMHLTSGAPSPMMMHAMGSPRGMPAPMRPVYSHTSPPQPGTSAQKPSSTTTLRASAPSFVPGGFRSSQQAPSMPRRPSSDRRRSDDHTPSFQSLLPRNSSSDALGNASRSASDAAVTTPAAPTTSGRDMVPSLIQQPAISLTSSEQPSAAPQPKAEAAAFEPSSDIAASVPSVADGPIPSTSEGDKAKPVPSHQQVSTSGNPSADPQAILSRPKAPTASAQPSSNPSGQDSDPRQPAAPKAGPSPAQQAPRANPAPPKWSTVAAMDRQSTHSQASTNSAAPLKKSSSADALRNNGAPSKDWNRPSQPKQQNHKIRPSPSTNQLDSRSSGGSKTAGDKRKVTRAGGVTWEGLQADLHRLKLVRGLSNEAGRNNCFLNVIIQSLWHLRSFREALLKMQPQVLESQGAPAEDVRVLRALLNIFNAFDQPREELPLTDGSDAGTPSAGEEADAKRAKREGQEDSAAAKVANGWTVSPAELREALSIVSRDALRFDLTDMHDAAEVLDRIFGSLQRAEMGHLSEGEPDAALPQRVKVSASGIHQTGSPSAKRRPLSLVETLFGLDVQVPSPPEDEEEEAQTVKRSKGTGGAVVGRWQETPSRSGRSQGSSPKDPKPAAGVKKAKDAGVVEMLQFIKLYHLVPAQGLKIAYDHLIGSSFEEILKEADVAEVLAQNANGGAHTPVSRVVKTSDIVLLKRPRVFSLALGWESAQAPVDVINATIDALAPQVDPAGVFKSAPSGSPYLLRCVVCYFGHHYKAYALSEELEEWLLFDDTTISHIGSWKDVTASLRGSRLQPNLLFYEQSA